MSQAQLAAKLGKHQSFVAKYELGERRLDVAEFVELAHILAIDACSVIREMEQGE